MKLLQKLHNRREPPGLEWAILKKLPFCLLGATLVPLLMAIGVRWFPSPGTDGGIAKQVTSVDIFAFALLLTGWTAVFTVAMGCVLVVVMKGPAYVADGYSPDDPKYSEIITKDD